MKNLKMQLQVVSKCLITGFTLIILLTAAAPLCATESTPDPPQFNTHEHPVLIVMDHNRQVFTVDPNGQVGKIVNDGNRDVVGLIGILAIITLAYWLVEHEIRKTTTCHPIADQNNICHNCQYNNNQPE